MKTVFYANIDGFDIVLGVGDAVIDPMATSKIIDEPFQASDEVKALRDLNTQLDAAYQNIAKAASQDQFDSQKSSIDAMAAKFQPLADAIAVKRSALMAQYAVWCQPGQGENLCEDAQGQAYLDAAKDGYKVKLDGTLVADNRNTVYWTLTAGTWTKTTITNLGDTVPAGSVKEADLSDAQRTAINTQADADRIAGLTPEQKSAEAAGLQQAEKAKVAQVQSEVAAGVSTQDALTSAVAAYKTALSGINAKYGTSLT